MEGYVINKSIGWRHAMKRSIGPGHKIELDDLYEQYGAKHELSEGVEFVDWLRQIKLSDHSTWGVVYNDGTNPVEEVKVKKDEKAAELVQPIMKKEMEVSDITGMSVREARDALKKITDLKILTYALSEANQMANKDTLCLMLRKRIQVLELTRR